MGNGSIVFFNDSKSGLLDRRQFLTKAGLSAAAVALLPMLSGRKAAAQFPGFGAPLFTRVERDRRWAAVREMMKKEGLDCLVVPAGGSGGMYQYAEYLSQSFFMVPGAVMFPFGGEPVVFGTMAMPGAWITHTVPAGLPLGGSIAEKLIEHGYERKTIGVVGTEAGAFGLAEFQNDGLMLYSIWAEVTSRLPKAIFRDVTREYALTTMVKGEEEIKRHEAAAQVGEELHKLLLTHVKVGLNPLN